jgi:hypothetical protein
MQQELIIRNVEGALEKFDPGRYRLQQAALDYSIEEAKRIRAWPALEAAVDSKIGEQRKFVAWWKARVTGQGTRRDLSREHGESLPMREAEQITGMKNQRVSDLSIRLNQVDTYRRRLLGGCYQAAMLEGGAIVRGTQGTGDEWFTPPECIAHARAVLGDIDLDPASCEIAQQVVRAQVFLHRRDGWARSRMARAGVAQSAVCADLGRPICNEDG